jgi:hypothetical protein
MINRSTRKFTSWFREISITNNFHDHGYTWNHDTKYSRAKGAKVLTERAEEQVHNAKEKRANLIRIYKYIPIILTLHEHTIVYNTDHI